MTMLNGIASSRSNIKLIRLKLLLALAHLTGKQAVCLTLAILFVHKHTHAGMLCAHAVGAVEPLDLIQLLSHWFGLRFTATTNTSHDALFENKCHRNHNKRNLTTPSKKKMSTTRF